MLNLKFPDTDVVRCVFSVKTKTSSPQDNMMNEQGVITDDRYLRTLKEYSYRVPSYLQGKLVPGDFVVVFCQTGYQVCQVVEINVLHTCSDSSTLAPVVARVDLQNWFMEADRKKKLDAMKAALVAERERLEKQQIWDMLADRNPEFATMLKAYRDAGGEI